MNTKSKEQLLAIISKQEEYIKTLEQAVSFISNHVENSFNKGRTLRDEIQKMKS